MSARPRESEKQKIQGLETRRKEDRLNKLGELRGRGFSGFPAPPLHGAPPQNPRFLLPHALSLPPWDSRWPCVYQGLLRNFFGRGLGPPYGCLDEEETGLALGSCLYSEPTVFKVNGSGGH